MTGNPKSELFLPDGFTSLMEESGMILRSRRQRHLFSVRMHRGTKDTHAVNTRTQAASRHMEHMEHMEEIFRFISCNFPQ
jgi:hypothetical protein